MPAKPFLSDNCYDTCISKIRADNVNYIFFFIKDNNSIKKSTKATFDLYLEQAQANVAR